jgi:hypothetical protein
MLILKQQQQQSLENNVGVCKNTLVMVIFRSSLNSSLGATHQEMVLFDM